MNNSKFILIKWIGLLPCVVLAYLFSFFLSGFVISQIVIFINSLPSLEEGKENCDWNKNGTTEFIQLVLSCYVYIIVGRLLAPKYKDRISLVLLAILTLVMFVNVFIKFHEIQYPVYMTIFCFVIGFATIYLDSDKRYVGGKFN